MQSRIEDIRALDGEVVAISVDPSDASQKLAKRKKITFSLLSDPQGEVMDLYGARHPDANPMGEGDIARPATFIVDRTGKIVWREVPDNWRIRIRPEKVIEQLGAIE